MFGQAKLYKDRGGLPDILALAPEHRLGLQVIEWRRAILDLVAGLFIVPELRFTRPWLYSESKAIGGHAGGCSQIYY